MQRHAVTPRLAFARRLEAQGLSFHARDQYWREDACYRFTLAEVECIEAAAEELHARCLDAVAHLVREGQLGRLGIPDAFHAAIGDSFDRDDFSLYGRFDLAFDGAGPPKLLEYNADTPTSLLEAAVCQWHWLDDVMPDKDQFNSLHERLVARWRELPGTGPVHLACLDGEEEDWACTTYLMDTLVQAGREGRQLAVEDIGWSDASQGFIGHEDEGIDTLFRLYPWEWMMRESFAPQLLQSHTRFIEPLWKAPLSCKGLLPVLWELFPGHPNLLPAYFEPGRLQAYAKKPLYSREGANITLVSADGAGAETSGPYGDAGYVYQALAPLPCLDGHYPVVGAWIIGKEAAGMGIREDRSPITCNTSHFVPHYFD